MGHKDSWTQRQWGTETVGHEKVGHRDSGDSGTVGQWVTGIIKQFNTGTIE